MHCRLRWCMKRKKKLLVLAGAGASVDLGMPATQQIHDLFQSWAQYEFPLAEKCESNLYSYITEQITEYYNKNQKDGLRKKVNFEETLYVILQLSKCIADNNFTNPLLAFISCRETPPVYHHGAKSRVDGFLLYWLAATLIDKLLDYFRNKCKAVDCESENFKKHISFWNKLHRDYSLGIYNLNYDNLILQALPEIETGFSKPSGLFNPRALMHAISWNFCYHIHGSVHFDMRNSNSMHRIYWQHDLNTQFAQNSIGRNAQATQEGYDFPTSVIVAGYEKLHQIRREPFRSYYNCLERAIFEADAILLVGYGMADEHINGIFEEYFEKNPRKPVLIATLSEANHDPIPFRCDPWIDNLCKIFHVNAHDFSCKGHSAPADIYSLKRKNLCEINIKNESIAVWHNGVLGLADHYQVVQEHLGA